MAAGLVKLGAAMPVNEAEEKDAVDALVEPSALAPGVAQPAKREPIDKAPRGSMGAAAKYFSAERREG